MRFGGEGVNAAVFCGGLCEAVTVLWSALRAGDFPGIAGGAEGRRRGGEVKVEEDIV